MSKGEDIFEPRYDDKKIEDVIYLRPTIWQDYDKNDGRKIEMLFPAGITVLEKEYVEQNTVEINGENFLGRTLYITEGGQQKITCNLIEVISNDGETRMRETLAYKIARRTGKGVYSNQEITLLPEAIDKLFDFIVQTKSDARIFDKECRKVPLQTDIDFNSIVVSKENFQKLLDNNIEYMTNYACIIDIKKKQGAITTLKEIIAGNYTNEPEITRFLKENPWLFDSEIVEFSKDGVINDKNLADLLPVDMESFVDIIEVKLPREVLFRRDKSHENYYPSSSLTKAVAQVQNYIFELETKRTNSRQENIIIRPRATILIGSNEELNDNEKKYLRILNASYHNIKIVTYQQLLKRAEKILDNSEQLNIIKTDLVKNYMNNTSMTKLTENPKFKIQYNKKDISICVMQHYVLKNEDKLIILTF